MDFFGTLLLLNKEIKCLFKINYKCKSIFDLFFFFFKARTKVAKKLLGNLLKENNKLLRVILLPDKSLCSFVAESSYLTPSLQSPDLS